MKLSKQISMKHRSYLSPNFVNNSKDARKNKAETLHFFLKEVETTPLTLRLYCSNRYVVTMYEEILFSEEAISMLVFLSHVMLVAQEEEPYITTLSS